MKRIFYLCCIGIFLFLVSACDEKKEKSILIDLDQSFDTKEIKLSELADDIRCIPLETNGDFLLPDNNTMYWVSDKYIISISDKDIRQFSSEGKFVRKLASAGKGPDEYSRILSYAVDENNDVLYYGHQGDWKHIFAIDLKNELPIRKINTRCLPKHIQIVKGNILCFPYNYRNEANCDAILITPQGHIIDSIPSAPKPAQEGSRIITPSMGLVVNNEDDIFVHRNDSLLHFSFNGLTPVIAFRYTDKFDPESHLEGVQWDVLFKNKNYAAIQKKVIAMKKTESMIMVNTTNDITLVIDLENFRPIKISGFTIDPLDEKHDEFPSFKLTGKKLVRKMSAFDLKELARIKRENGEPLPPVLQQLDTQLTEESNPVLIIGNLK